MRALLNIVVSLTCTALKLLNFLVHEMESILIIVEKKFNDDVEE